MISPLDKKNKDIMIDSLNELEEKLQADIIVLFGPLYDGLESKIKELIEDLDSEKKRAKQLDVILTTSGGSLYCVKRIVNIFRNFYDTITFIVPDYAYSAGTVLCCSGDDIVMSYYSVLGPIDPQVRNKDGRFVAALGYLDKINELIVKSKNGDLSPAEFVILKDFDLAELRVYEQARDLAIDLLIEWLPKYKFKNWKKKETSQEQVTKEDKVNRAKEIAQNLSDNKEWKSHGRPINRDELEKLKLKITKLEDFSDCYKDITDYYKILIDYCTKYGVQSLLHTRRVLLCQ